MCNDRVEEMRRYIDDFTEERYLQSYEKAKAFIDRSKDTLLQELSKSFAELLHNTMEKQRCGEKDPIRYLVISYLRHSYLVDRYSFLLQTYDETFYLDEVETSSKYHPDFLWELFKEDMVYFERCLQRRFVRIKPYELEAITGKYIERYNAIVRYLMELFCPLILDMDGYEELLKEDKLQIIFNNYRDKGVCLSGIGINAYTKAEGLI
jgi:hypothetical protein